MIASNLQLQVDRITYPKRADISAAPATQILLRDTMRGIKNEQQRIRQGILPQKQRETQNSSIKIL